jgi:arylsulfatase A-like enzyme
VLQQAGYRTACIGKWGLGGPKKSSGQPNKQGFDYFFGYTGHGQAHEYYPDHLWRNTERVELKGKSYSHDLFVKDAQKWVRDNRDRPFFLYLPFTIPHSNLQVPDLEPYADLKWRPYHKAIAAMITRMDSGIGLLFATLKELNLDDKTVVFFTSDNGPDRGDAREFFNASGSFRGKKRGMYEGGLRVPMLARWPGHAPAGKVCDEPWAFWDLLPTCADLAGAKIPIDAKIDGLSIVPVLQGGSVPKRDYFYWEIHEPWSSRAVRFGDFKAVRPNWTAPIEIYNIEADASESQDLASSRPDLVKKGEELMKAAHVDSPKWSVITPEQAAAKQRVSGRPQRKPRAK